MINKREKTGGSPDGRTSEERNATALEAIASPHDYPKVVAPAKQKRIRPAAPDLVQMAFSRKSPVTTGAGLARDKLAKVAVCDPAGRIWACSGKRGRVLATADNRLKQQRINRLTGGTRSAAI